MSSNIELCPYMQGTIEITHYPQCSCKTPPQVKYPAILPLEAESCPRAQKWLKRVKMPPSPKSVYNKLLRIANSQPPDQQILLDISRTYSQVEYFTDGLGRAILYRVLNAFSTYSPNLGYVQGMNYIAATLLWHSNEVDAFWLFVVLLEDFQLRDNYLSGFPGLRKHYHVIDFLISQHLPPLYSHLLNLNIAVQMFSTEWLMTLFTNIVPLQQSYLILQKFFKHGWLFVYKLSLEILIRLSEKLIKTNNFAHILQMLKPVDCSFKEWKVFLKNLEKGREKINWERVIMDAKKLELNERFLNCMMHNATNVLAEDFEDDEKMYD